MVFDYRDFLLLFFSAPGEGVYIFLFLVFDTSDNFQRAPLVDKKGLIFTYALCTPGSMSSLFSDFSRKLCRVVLGDVWDYLGEMLGGF